MVIKLYKNHQTISNVQQQHQTHVHVLFFFVFVFLSFFGFYKKIFQNLLNDRSTQQKYIQESTLE